MNNSYETINNFSIIGQIQQDISKSQSNANDIYQLLKLENTMNQISRQDNFSPEDKERNVPSFLENSSPQNSELISDEGINNHSKNTESNNNSTLKRKVLESVSEEIATHLKVILDYADQLKHFYLPSEANKILQKIIDKSNFIITSLKTQTTLYNGGLELNTQVIYATTLFDDILNLIAGYAEFRGIKLFRRFEADASILADKNMLYQACLNIVKFLCESMQNKGEIIVLLTRTKDTIILKFQAKGIIISDDFFRNVFQSAAFEEQVTLSYAQSIVNAHKGSIKTGRTIDSTPEINLELPIIR